jgi:hypothetical protein
MKKIFYKFENKKVLSRECQFIGTYVAISWKTTDLFDCFNDLNKTKFTWP